MAMKPKTDAELLAECYALDRCYAEAEAFDLAHQPPLPEDAEGEGDWDPVRDGWVGKDGRP